MGAGTYISPQVGKLSNVSTRLWRPPTIRDVSRSLHLLKSTMSSLTEPCVFFSPGSLVTTTSRMSPDRPSRLAVDSRYHRNYFKHIHSYEPQGRRGRGRGKGKGNKGAFMKMLMVAHCETANDNDERFVFWLKHNWSNGSCSRI